MKKTFISFRLLINSLFLNIILLLGVGSLLLHSHHHQQQLISISLEEQANSISALIAEDLARLMFLNDPSAASDISLRLNNITILKSAQIFDINNEQLFEIINTTTTGLEQAYTIKTKAQYKYNDLGYVKFYFYSEKLTLLSNHLRAYFILFIITLTLLSIIFIYFIDRRFTIRFTDLSNALQQTAFTKDFSIRLKPKRLDEIGQAQNNFNKLVSMVETKEKLLNSQINHDNLTGLYSRKILLEKIQASIINKTGAFNALCYIDLDQFKIVNDTCGHQVGDMLLMQLANKFKDFVALYSDVEIGRIGGDEFILLIINRTLNEIDTITSELLIVIKSLDFKFIERTFLINASIGAITYTKNDTNISADKLLSAADAACYEAKAAGRNRIICHSVSEQHATQNQQEMNLVTQINTALNKDTFLLFLQPIIDSSNASSSTYNHFETLLRMPDEKDKSKMISPAIFIPAAENYGLSTKIDYWVINNLFAKLTTERGFLESTETISINLSIATIVSKRMTEKIAKLFLQYKIDYKHICFEITETGVSSQVVEAMTFISFFKNLGVRFSLDDFGTGMSSFKYLSELDVDYLKIDGYFIKDMHKNKNQQNMVLAMCNMGKALNKKIVAEYVEVEQEVLMLQAMGVEFLQGYYFSQPKPIEFFIEQVKTRL